MRFTKDFLQNLKVITTKSSRKEKKLKPKKTGVTVDRVIIETPPENEYLDVMALISKKKAGKNKKRK
jgi:hypothetical protein